MPLRSPGTRSQPSSTSMSAPSCAALPEERMLLTWWQRQCETVILEIGPLTNGGEEAVVDSEGILLVVQERQVDSVTVTVDAALSAVPTPTRGRAFDVISEATLRKTARIPPRHRALVVQRPSAERIR